MKTNKEHAMYPTYLYWKKNERVIKDRIKQTFELEYDLK